MSAERIQESDRSDLKETLVSIRRVAKVVKGGRRFRFSALVVVGDGKGKVGYDTASAVEVMEAKKKSHESAKKRMIRVPLRDGRTLHHDVVGKFGAASVVVRAAPAGTGIIAGGALRAVFECLGVSDVVVKSVGTSNPHNLIRACFNAFENIHSPRQIADKRGKKIGDIISRRDDNTNAKKKDIKDGKEEKQIKVTQVKSPIGRQKYQKVTLVGLGLNKINRSKILEDTDSVRGMINNVKHLVVVEEVA